MHIVCILYFFITCINISDKPLTLKIEIKINETNHWYVTF